MHFVFLDQNWIPDGGDSFETAHRATHWKINVKKIRLLHFRKQIFVSPLNKGWQETQREIKLNASICKILTTARIFSTLKSHLAFTQHLFSLYVLQ